MLIIYFHLQSDHYNVHAILYCLHMWCRVTMTINFWLPNLLFQLLSSSEQWVKQVQRQSEHWGQTERSSEITNSEEWSVRADMRGSHVIGHNIYFYTLAY